MTTTEARVLSALAPGGQLTADQIARHVDISVRRATKAVQSLAARGFIMSGGIQRGTWHLTQAGAKFTSTNRGRATLEVPQC